MKNKWEPFLVWLWSKRDIDVSFSPGVLTETNDDPSLPRPPLTITDSLNLFRLMELKELAFKIEEHVYVLNKVEEYKWDDLLEEITRPAWKRHWITKHAISIILFLIAAVIGGIVGGYFTKIGEDLVAVKHGVESATDVAAHSTTNSPQKK